LTPETEKANINQSKILKTNAELLLEKKKKELILALENAVSVYNELIKTLAANKNAISLAETSFHMSQDLLRSGYMSVTNLNDAELYLTGQKIKKELTLVNLEINLADIEKLAGATMNKKRIFIYSITIAIFAIAVFLKQNEVKAIRVSSPVTFNDLWKKNGKPVITKKIYRKNIPQYEKITLKPSGNIFVGYVPRKISEKLKPGQKTHAQFNGTKAKGEITYVSQKISFDTGMNLVKGVFNCRAKCDKWMVTYVKVGSVKNALTIPDSILTRENDKTYVWTVKDSLAVKKEIFIKNSDGYNSFIKKGLYPGEEVVFTGQTLLSEGDKILRITTDNGELQ